MFFQRGSEAGRDAPMQPPRPMPRSGANSRNLMLGASLLTLVVAAGFVSGLISYGGIPGSADHQPVQPPEPEQRLPIHALPETEPPREPDPQQVRPMPPPEPQAPATEQLPAKEPEPPVKASPEPKTITSVQREQVVRPEMFGKMKTRERVSLASDTDSSTDGTSTARLQDGAVGRSRAVGSGQSSYGPRNSRESFAASAGRGRKIYHDASMVEPPGGMCVLRGSDIWPLTTPQEIRTALPGGFTMRVIADVHGRIYDGVGSRPCEYPAIPAATLLECEGNTSDVRRGDKAVQAVCSLAVFPGGKTLPLDGFMLTGPDGMVGMPADSRYNWGDEIKGTAIDIIGAIPGALLNLATLGAVGGLADVALNIGTNNFQQSTQMYRQEEHKVVPILYIPRDAPAGLRPGMMVALPDEER